MGLFSGGGGSSRSSAMAALQAVKNAETDMTSGFTEVGKALEPYKTDAAFWNQYQAEVLGSPEESKFQMNPMHQAYVDAKMQNVAQMLANSGMQFSGAGIEQLGATGAEAKYQLYQNYLNQIMGGMGMESGILGMQTGNIGEYYGGLADADLARGNIFMQYGAQKAQADRARGGAMGSLLGGGLGMVLGGGLGTLGLLAGGMMGSQIGGGFGSAY